MKTFLIYIWQFVAYLFVPQMGRQRRKREVEEKRRRKSYD